MDDFMMYKYLKSKGMSEQDFINRFKQAMKIRRDSRYYDQYPMEKDWNRYNIERYGDYLQEYDDFLSYDKRGYEYDDMYNRMNYMRHSMEGQIDEHKAKHLVSEMYHTEGNRKYSGEKFNMIKAREVYDKYKSMLPQDVTVEELYVAINAQYHDYCALFKSWNLSNIDHKIIESAIVFWFNDVDYKERSKVQKYFND